MYAFDFPPPKACTRLHISPMHRYLYTCTCRPAPGANSTFNLWWPAHGCAHVYLRTSTFTGNRAPQVSTSAKHTLHALALTAWPWTISRTISRDISRTHDGEQRTPNGILSRGASSRPAQCSVHAGVERRAPCCVLHAFVMSALQGACGCHHWLKLREALASYISRDSVQEATRTCSICTLPYTYRAVRMCPDHVNSNVALQQF